MAERPKIQITKRVSVVDEEGGVRLRLWVSGATGGIPPTLFVYQLLPNVPKSEFPRHEFVHIASYADIAAFPENSPDAYAPFFRKNGMDLTFKTRALLEDTWNLCKAHLKLTVEDITRIDGLPPAEIEVIEL